MKALIVLGGFFPAQTYGGPTISIDNLCSLLCSEIEFYILTSDHELNKTDRLNGISEGWNVRQNCKVMYLRKDEENSKKYAQVVAQLRPDFIYINSLFSASKTVPFLRIAKRNNIPILLAPRGELCVNSFDKKYKKIPYLILLSRYLRAKNVWYQSTSEEEEIQIAKTIRVNPNKILRLTNVATVPNTMNLSKSKQKGSCNLVFVSRIQEKKNLSFALQCLAKVKAKVSFSIYGPLESLKYWDKCQGIINNLPENINVEYKGMLQHDEVLRAFSKYHAFLFPTLSENYGHVMVEAMLSGCPIITSDQVPWTDVNNVGAGWSIPLTDMDSFVAAIEKLALMNQQEYQTLQDACINYIVEKVDMLGVKAKYIHSFKKIVNDEV